MRVADFLHLAARYNIRRDAYSIKPEWSGGPEEYVLKRDGEGWRVFYNERGLSGGETLFNSESEALNHLILTLLTDLRDSIDRDIKKAVKNPEMKWFDFS